MRTRIEQNKYLIRKSKKITTVPAWRSPVIPPPFARASLFAFGLRLRLVMTSVSFAGGELPSYVSGAPIPTQPLLPRDTQSIYLSHMYRPDSCGNQPTSKFKNRKLGNKCVLAWKQCMRRESI